MGDNKKRRQKISAWLEQIGKHEQKIAREQAKRSPDKGLIRKWHRDIQIFESEIAKVARKLPQSRKKR